jgi:hypothetical protein
LQPLATKGIQRLETLLMPANFSSIVSEFVIASIPKYCATLVKNRYHNGHPDLIPVNTFPDNRIQYAHEGIEVKASRYLRAWQGHNPEDVWLMVLVFESNRASDDLHDARQLRGKADAALHGIFPFRLPVIQTLSEITFATEVTFLVGKDGSGRSADPPSWKANASPPPDDLPVHADCPC